MNGKFRFWIPVLLFLFLFVPPLLAQGEAGDILARINNLRASAGLPPYSVNGALSAAAQQHAQWIADTGNVSHTRPDGSGPRTRALANGYPSSDVSENIYGGTMATADTAWAFWVNSPSHYNGMVHRAYRDVGIGIATTAWGTAYVVVFGNPGGPPPAPPASSGGGGGNAQGGGGVAVAAVPALPSYVVGQDEHGNIMHEVQPGDTLGDIALIYGYTWDDLPYMMQLNNIGDVYDLEPGTIFLVPPQGGTWTPEPGAAQDTDDSEPTTTPTPSVTPSETPTPTTGPTVTRTPFRIATAAQAPEELLRGEATEAPAGTPVAAADIPGEGTPGALPVQAGTATIVRSGPSPWLGIALAVQVVLLLGAFVEFFRRARKRR